MMGNFRQQNAPEGHLFETRGYPLPSRLGQTFPSGLRARHEFVVIHMELTSRFEFPDLVEARHFSWCWLSLAQCQQRD